MKVCLYAGFGITGAPLAVVLSSSRYTRIDPGESREVNEPKLVLYLGFVMVALCNRADHYIFIL